LDVSPRRLQVTLQEVPFKALDLLSQAPRGQDFGKFASLLNPFREVVEADDGFVGQQGGVADGVAELPDVAGPGVAQ
jgi:hypothetical protein